MNFKELQAKVLGILDGIEREETDEPEGWWPTSDGAKFGKDALVQIRAAFMEAEHPNGVTQQPTWLPVTETAQDVLADIFSNSERPDKLMAYVDEVAHTVTVQYQDLDEEWFKEFSTAMRSDPQIGEQSSN